jgi:hypothetical protein
MTHVVREVNKTGSKVNKKEVSLRLPFCLVAASLIGHKRSWNP